MEYPYGYLLSLFKIKKESNMVRKLLILALFIAGALTMHNEIYGRYAKTIYCY